MYRFQTDIKGKNDWTLKRLKMNVEVSTGGRSLRNLNHKNKGTNPPKIAIYADPEPVLPWTVYPMFVLRMSMKIME